MKSFVNSVSGLLNDYERTTAADFTRYAFPIDGKVYEIVLKALPLWLVKLDRESSKHGGAEKIRINPTAINKQKLLRMGAAYIGTIEELFDPTVKNKGHKYEKYCTEKAGQAWKADRIEYYKDGDLTVNGIKYQIKYDDASLANVNTINAAKQYRNSQAAMDAYA